jgi:hypothetical protein
MLIPKPMPWMFLRLRLIDFNHIYVSLKKGTYVTTATSLYPFSAREFAAHNSSCLSCVTSAIYVEFVCQYVDGLGIGKLKFPAT